jgi:hypothetical protein
MIRAALQHLRQTLRAAAEMRNLPYTVLGALLALSLLSRLILLLP